MFNSIGNFNNPFSSSLQLLRPSQEHNTTTRLPSNTQLTPTLERVQEMLKPLDQMNWAQIRVNLIQNQPNLAVAFSIIDILCPKDETQTVTIAGLDIQGPHVRQYHQPSQLRVSQSESVLLQSKNKIHQWVEGLPGGLQRFGSSRRLNSSNLQNYASLPEATGYLEDRHKAIQVILSHLILGKQGIKGNLFLQKNEQGQIDLSPEAIGLIADALLGNDTPVKSIRLENLIEVIGQIEYSNNAGLNQDKVLGSGLSQTESKALLRLNPVLINLVSVIDQFLYLKNDIYSEGNEAFPIFSNDQLPFFLSECRKNKQLHASTFIDEVKRFVNPNHSSLYKKNQALSWLSNLGDQQTGYDHEGQLILAIVDQATKQLLVGENPEMFFDKGSLLPLAIYQLVGDIIQKPLPSFLIHFETEAKNHLNELKEQRHLSLRSEEARIKKSRQLDQRKAEESQKKLELAAQSMGVQPNFDQIITVERGSSTVIQDRTFDVQLKLNQPFDEELQNALIETYLNVDVSSKHRSQEAITRLNQGTPQPFFTDNLCWLRASWLSVFEQFDTPDQLACAIEQAQIGFYFPKIGDYAKPFILGTKKIMEAYQKDRLGFLHLGEEDDFLDKPAHFRCGQSVSDCLNTYGIDNQFSASGKATIDYGKYDLESFLKEVLTRLSAGIRSVVPELVVLDQPSMMATSDIPTALY